MPIPKVVSKTPLYDRYKRAGGQFNYTQWKEKGTPSLPMSAAARALAAKPAPAKAAPAPVDPMAWLNTPDEKTIDKQVQAETYSKYHPQFQQFIEARNISKANEKRIGDWYGEYAAEIKAGAEASRNAVTSAAQATSDASKTLEAGAATEQAARQAAANADAKTRGATAVDFTDLANRASLSRQSGANASASLMRDLGANAFTRSQGIAGNVVGAQKLQAKTQELGRRNKLEAGRTDLIKQMGDYRIANKEQRRKMERDYLAAVEALNIKGENAKSLIEDRTLEQNLAQLKSEGGTQEQIDAAEAKVKAAKLVADALAEQRRIQNDINSGNINSKSDVSPAAKRIYQQRAQGTSAKISALIKNGRFDNYKWDPVEKQKYDNMSDREKTTYRSENDIPTSMDLKNTIIGGDIPRLTTSMLGIFPNTDRIIVEAALRLYGSRILGSTKRRLTSSQWNQLYSLGVTNSDFKF